MQIKEELIAKSYYLFMKLPDYDTELYIKKYIYIYIYIYVTIYYIGIYIENYG